MTDADLPDLAIFAAALAAAEADAWRSGDGVLATQAYEERRFLAADRIAPWAVPWLISAGRCFPESRAAATDAVTRLLEIGERHRWAPALAGHEGLLPPGHDGYGPAAEPRGLALRMHSLWGGGVLFGRSILALSGGRTASRRPERRLLGAPGFRGDVHTWYEVAAVRWERLAGRQPGSTRNWLDLAVRARLTAEIAK